MSEDQKIVIDAKKVKNAIKRLFGFQTLLFLLIAFTNVFAIVYTNQQLDERFADSRYDPQLAELSSVGVSLRIFWRNNTDSTIQLENYHVAALHDVKTEIIFFNYSFRIEKLALTPEWNEIYLFFQIDENAFIGAAYLECRYIIEEHSETLRKEDYKLSDEGFPFYIAKVNIDRWMFKDAVPDTIEAKIEIYI
jgi:energy-coupling factor transporter transmembrane protein EcfT